MASWAELLTRAEPGDHLVQLYGEDHQLLAKNVSRYLAEGFRSLDGLVVIATPDHTHSISRHLAEETAGATLEAERDGRLVLLDARATLDRLLVDGRPDKARFDAVVGHTLKVAREQSGSGKVRAFGEMVGLLWDAERYGDAGLLEAYWNEALAGSSYSLFCAYRCDLFDTNLDPAGLNPIVTAHSHVLAGSGTVLSSHRD